MVCLSGHVTCLQHGHGEWIALQGVAQFMTRLHWSQKSVSSPGTHEKDICYRPALIRGEHLDPRSWIS